MTVVSPFPDRAAEDGDALRPVSPILWDGQPVPRRRWLVDHLIPQGNVTMLSGDGGHGKSLLAQQLMTALALGRPWLGRDTKPVRVLGVFCEDDLAELQIRQDAINRHYGCSMGDVAESMLLASRVDRDSYLCRFDRWGERMEPTPLWRDIRATAKELGAQLVVLDTARKTFGGNEISDRQVSRYIVMLRRLAIELDGAVLFTLHPSNEGLASGSGIAGNRAWRNEVRSMMYLTDAGKDAEKEPDRRILRVKKSNYGPPGGKIELRWRHGAFHVLETAPPARNYHEPAEAPF